MINNDKDTRSLNVFVSDKHTCWTCFFLGEDFFDFLISSLSLDLRLSVSCVRGRGGGRERERERERERCERGGRRKDILIWSSYYHS